MGRCSVPLRRLPSALVSAATRTRTPTLDAGCAEAVDLARAAALEQAGPAGVGEHLGTAADDDRVVTHRFAALAPGYVGWHWAVTVARASRAKAVTVDEVCLLPGPDALVAPPWVPWAERLRPGDLGVGDLLPAPADDPRLEPGYHGTARRSGDGDEVAEVARELGLGRPRVLSPLGIDEAADRWLNGPGGPHTPLAEAAPGRCVTCGFVVRLGGLLGQAFAVCANEYAPSDGRVVSLDHGCGAHSDAVRAPAAAAPPVPVVDEVGYDELGHG